MKIAIYDTSDVEQSFLRDTVETFFGNRMVYLKLYSCLYDMIYDIEEGKQYDIVIFGAEHQVQTLVIGEEIKRMVRDVLLIYIGKNTEYAPKALEIGAFRYIIMESKATLVNELFAAVKELQGRKGRQYVIATKRHYLIIPCDDIQYCYKSGKMSVIVTGHGEYKERIPLYELYIRLKNLSNDFIMIERGHIVSISKVSRIEKSLVVLEGDISLPVGRTYTAVLRDIKFGSTILANRKMS